MATFILVIKANKKDDAILEKILCIYYLLCFQKDNVEINALTNFGSKVNIMILAYILKLDFQVCFTNVIAPKIDNFTFKIFEMVLASF